MTTHDRLPSSRCRRISIKSLVGSSSRTMRAASSRDGASCMLCKIVNAKRGEPFEASAE